TPDVTPTNETTAKPTTEPTAEPTATPAETTKLKELEYTDKVPVSFYDRAFVSDRNVFVEYAQPGESTTFYGYDVKLRLFESEFQGFNYTQSGMQIVIELTSKDDKSVEYYKTGFVNYNIEDSFSCAYIAMVYNLCGNYETMYFVTMCGNYKDTTFAFVDGRITEITGSPYDFGNSSLIMEDTTDIIGYKNIFIEYDVYYNRMWTMISAKFLQRRTPSKIEFAISNNEGYPEPKNADDYVPYHKVLQEFEAFIMTSKGNYIKGKIEAGVKLKPVATDRMGRVFFETNTGKSGYFDITFENLPDGKPLVAGIMQEELFDNIFYP
ncbi:MAG: hypothetical protein GX802_02200, partial [Clostridiales bacterium]|nr:hypothetical protein [Clostridiales bacterium]